MERFFLDHGYRVGDQRRGELLMSAYIRRDWEPILDHCTTAECFQDIPFSNEYLYTVLDYYFPHAQFILTERSTPEAWYRSITTFHAHIFGTDGKIPTKEDLQRGTYCYQGWIWETFKEKYGEVPGDIYNKDHLIRVHTERNRRIKKYFSARTNFLALDIARTDAARTLASFLNITPQYPRMPWENKTAELSKRDAK